MLDFEEYSLGHQDLLSNKYYSTVNVCPSPSTMDLLLSAGDSVSFNDMLDLDIKAEIDTVLGGHSDFASFNFGDFPPLDMDDSPSDNMWFTNNSNHSNSNFNIDFIGSEAAAMMVNPNSVMPLTLVTVPSKPASPTLTLTEKKTIKTSSAASTFSPVFKVAESIKHEINKKEHQPMELKRPLAKTIKVSSSNTINNSRSIIRTSQHHNQQNQQSELKGHSLLNIKSAIQKQLVSGGNFSSLSGVRVVTHGGRKQQFNNNRLYGAAGDDVKEYPKPAYSYSCLIAMALKNSRTGSLPVSEIYNFMCEHFPYFKTAPNGWKNSVRHNLSLNKCFEKIEKPAVSGAQRKGCLWAMNPAKISKMDEEVQKWSRKDPSAIRKAMINPEHLEALERGELKYSCRNNGENEDGYGNDSSADTEEEEEEEGAEEQEEDAGSDVEVEDRLHEIQALNFVNVNEGDEECGFDIEVADTFYENDSEDQPTIKIEMEVVDNDLLEYIDSPSKKRSRSILELDENFGGRRIYQVQAPSRRKTAYLIKNE